MRLGLLVLLVASETVFAGAHFTEGTSSRSTYTRSWGSQASVKWRLRTSGAPSGAQALIERSFQAWVAETDANIRVTYEGTTSVSRPTEDGFSDFIFDIPFSAIGISNDLVAVTVINGDSEELSGGVRTARIREADILINPRFSGEWVTGIPAAATDLDLQEVITHEIGHLLGLAHSFLVDSIMFPSKPSTNLASSYIALFRVPKRALAEDDAAWLAKLYPTSEFRTQTSEISGQIKLNGEPFVGAHVVAYKSGESDLQLLEVGSSGSADLVFKGMQNIGAFSEVDGRFTLPGLTEGTYGLLVQDGDTFLSFSLSRVNTYLDRFGTSQLIPNQFFSISAASDQSNTASLIEVVSGSSLCDLEIVSGEPAEGIPSAQNSGQCRSSGGGGCAMKATERTDAATLAALGFLFALIFLRRGFRRKAHAVVLQVSTTDCISLSDPIGSNFRS